MEVAHFFSQDIKSKTDIFSTLSKSMYDICQLKIG